MSFSPSWGSQSHGSCLRDWGLAGTHWGILVPGACARVPLPAGADGVCHAGELGGSRGCSGPCLPGPSLLLRPGWSPPPLLGQALPSRGGRGRGSGSCQHPCDSALEKMGFGQGLRGPAGDGRERESRSACLLHLRGPCAGAQGNTCLARVLPAAPRRHSALLSLPGLGEDAAGGLQPLSRAVLAVSAGMTTVSAPCTGPAARAAPTWSTCSSCGGRASTS